MFELDKSLLNFDLDIGDFENDNNEEAIKNNDNEARHSPIELVNNDTNSCNTYLEPVKLLHDSDFNNDDQFNQSFNFYVLQDETNDIEIDNIIENQINLLDSQIETLNEVLAEIDDLILRPLTSLENVTDFFEKIRDEMEIC